jgi:hypothetical protein
MTIRTHVSPGALALGVLVSGVAVAGNGASAPPQPFAVVGSLGGALTGLAATDEGVVVGQGARLVILGRASGGGLRVEARLETDAALRGIAAIDGRTVAAWTAGQVVFVDLTRLDTPKSLATYHAGAEVLSVAARDGLCFVLEPERLVVVHLEPSSAVVTDGAVSLAVRAKSTTLVVAGDGVVFVGRYLDTIIAVDVSNPLAPAVLGYVEGPVAPLGMAAAGRWLYYLDGALHYDSTGRPLRGTWLGRVAVDENGSIRHTDPVALVAPGETSFRGALVETVGTDVAVYGVSLSGDLNTPQPEVRLWAADTWPSPAESATISLPPGTGEYLASSGKVLCLAGNGVSLADGGRLGPQVTMIDVESAAGPQIGGFWASGDLGRVTAAAAVHGDVALAEEWGNIALFDGRAPTDLQGIGWIPPEETGFGVVRMAGVSDRLHILTSRLTVFDLADSAHPVRLLDSPVAGNVLPVLAVEGSRVVLAEGTLPSSPAPEPGYSLVVFDAPNGDGGIPERAVEFPVGSLVSDAELAHATVYAAVRPVVDGTEVLVAYDLSAFGQPDLLGHVQLPAGLTPKSMAVSQNRMYVFGRLAPDGGAVGGGLQVVDMAPGPLGRLRGAVRTARQMGFVEPVLTGQHYPMALLGPYALVAGHEAMVRVVAVSDPDRPEEVQDIPMADLVVDIAAGEQFAHVVLADGEVIVLRWADFPGTGAGRRACLPLVVAAH